MRALVTGGGGFLGGAIIDKLLARDWEVRSIARNDYPHLREKGVATWQGDIAEGDALEDAIAGCDVVFHVAAKAGVWGSYDSYHRSNVLATERILSACEKAGVERLVYTSTPSVVFAGKDESGTDESAPYPEHFLNHYARTKAEAERKVLAANGDALAVAALRPHLIWGPGDPHLVPRILDRARRGKLKLVGSGENRVDSVYIDNAAEAHVLAAEALQPGAACAGKAYFITNGEPLPMRELLNKILAAGDLPPVTKSVPPGVAYAVGALLESVYGLLGKQDEPIMTRFVARQLATEHWFDIRAAYNDFDYAPAISIDEGMERLRASLQG